MNRSLLIGLATGLRSMTPLAAVSAAVRQGRLKEGGALGLLGSRVVARGMAALAVGEALGDEWRKAPDRIIAPGIAARVITGGLAGAALAPPRRRTAGAILGVSGAVIGAYVGFNARVRAMRRFGQTPSGLVEDLIAAGSALWLVRSAPSEPTGRTPVAA